MGEGFTTTTVGDVISLIVAMSMLTGVDSVLRVCTLLRARFSMEPMGVSHDSDCFRR